MTQSVHALRRSRTEYLDQAAATELGRDYKHKMIAMMDLLPGARVLDIGCGPGTDLADLAMATGNGDVIGVDADPTMVAEARRRMAAYPNVRVCEGDAHALPLADASVDRARLDRVVQHLADPAVAVAEAARVLHASGTLVVADTDWDTLVIDDPDVETSRAYTRFVTRDVVRNGPIGRQLPRLAVAAGLQVHSVVAAPALFTSYEAADEILRLDAVMKRAVAAGVVDAAPAAKWIARLQSGPFLAGFTFFMIVAGREDARCAAS